MDCGSSLVCVKPLNCNADSSSTGYCAVVDSHLDKRIRLSIEFIRLRVDNLIVQSTECI